LVAVTPTEYKYQNIMTKYDYKSIDIIIFSRRNDGIKVPVVIQGFEPYIYVPADEKIPEHKGISRIGKTTYSFMCKEGEQSDEKEKVVQIILKHPKFAREIRKLFTHHFEADVPFARRFLIDKEIINGFKVNQFDGKIYLNDIVQKNCPNISGPKCWHDDIIPIDFELDPLVGMIDIEVDSRDRFPDPQRADDKIVCATVWDSYYQHYFTFLLDQRYKVKKMNKNWHIFGIKSEKQLLDQINNWYWKKWVDVLGGWNIKFDTTTIINRAKKIGYKIDFPGTSDFDIQEAHKISSNKSLGRRLKEVALAEGLATEEEMIATEYHNDLWEDKDLHLDLAKYNMDDVKYCVMLNNKYHLVNFFWKVKNYEGLEDINSALYFNVIIDTGYLRESKYVLPSRISS